jgi:hypothetical protein
VNDLNDDEIRARFAELRAADETGAPDFADLLNRGSHRRARVSTTGTRWTSPLALSLAAAAVIVAAVGVARVSASRRAGFVAPPLSAWTSPTAALLRTPGIKRTRPATLMSSLVDIAASTAIPRTEKHK